MTAQGKLIVLDPTLAANDAPVSRMARRLSTLDGKVVGCLWNNRYQGDMILERVVQGLRKRHMIKDIVHVKKDYIGEAAPRDAIERLARSCDAVVLAVGD